MKYFSYDPTDEGWGFEIHDTAKAAKERALKALLDFRDAGWNDTPDDSVESICWGELKGEVQKVMVEQNDDGVMTYDFQLTKVK